MRKIEWVINPNPSIFSTMRNCYYPSNLLFYCSTKDRISAISRPCTITLCFSVYLNVCCSGIINDYVITNITTTLFISGAVVPVVAYLKDESPAEILSSILTVKVSTPPVSPVFAKVSPVA